MVDFAKLEPMTDAEERRFVSVVAAALADDHGDEAKRHLAAGRPIYYSDDRFGDGIVKEYPDGRRQLVVFRDDAEVVLRAL
ncbi:conserved hypothetical protein [Magnetospirillum sp. LM-5]|uniref:hypothetical protein n=1 Tax=Magnetospirillum sp. LM-5 TaxID=2681466 RepID=UPI001380EFCE|nr:hypothetical protein [Magnetospirillum sp. LM-5]CAA7625983.1 conserved hypothetical protein [Magnetospirillum sp. LM-5]